MKSVRYIGPSGTGVTIFLPDPASPRSTIGTVCKPGETVQLPEAVADAYIDGGIFETVAEPAEEKPKRVKATTAATEQKEYD